MNLISCRACGLVYDLDNVNMPEGHDDNGNVTEDADWCYGNDDNGDKGYYPFVACSCGGRIYGGKL